MHDDATRRSAALTRCANGAEEDRLGRHFKVSTWANDERIVPAQFHNRFAKPAMNCLRNMHTHLRRAGGGDQRDALISRQFLSHRLAVAHEQSKNRRIGSCFATDALGNFCHGNRGERRFFRSFPNRRVAADGGQRRVPRPDRDWKIESADHCNNTERMPLLHQTVTGPFRLNRQAIKHARLTNCEIADVDHLLHFTFAFRDNFPGLERNELTEIMFGFA